MSKFKVPFEQVLAIKRGKFSPDIKEEEVIETIVQAHKKVLEETGNEAEAVYQALEVINFSRKGRGAFVRTLSISSLINFCILFAFMSILA